MPERSGLITFQGHPLTLVGSEVSVGMRAPDFRVLDTGLKEVHLDSLPGQVKVLVTVPSLDTSVCSLETRRFNDEAAKMGDAVSVSVVSMDLPFAQKRWVDEYKVGNLATYSDHREASLGMAYGILIKELRLLARAIFIIGRDGHVAWQHLVPEVTNEPDYDAVLAAIREVAG